MIGLVVAAVLSLVPVRGQMIGINVILNTSSTPGVLAQLGTHGQILDVIPEINAVTMRANAAELAAIQALSSVAAANPDAERRVAGEAPILPPAPLTGAGPWNLDAINVTDFGLGRTVAYDGEGVYVAVIDDGLVDNWREYFPEDRIATQFAQAFSGGGGEHGTVSSQPNVWEHANVGHGMWVASVLLGFHYLFTAPPLPAVFDGVAPNVTVIPVKNVNNNANLSTWSSTLTRAILYVTDLKISGALGIAPVVINMSQGGTLPDAMELAAIDRAIANGIVCVAAAGNDADAGMHYPATYAPVISAGASGWVRQWPLDGPTIFAWVLRDVPEADVLEHFITPFSAWELPGRDLDVVAPGLAVAVPFTVDGSQVDYAYFGGTSAASPHLAGVAALMLQKNPGLSAGQIEAILEATAMPIPPDCRTVIVAIPGNGIAPTLGNQFFHAQIFPFSFCWGPNVAGHGLLQADAALAATPSP